MDHRHQNGLLCAYRLWTSIWPLVVTQIQDTFLGLSRTITNINMASVGKIAHRHVAAQITEIHMALGGNIGHRHQHG